MFILTRGLISCLFLIILIPVASFAHFQLAVENVDEANLLLRNLTITEPLLQIYFTSQIIIEKSIDFRNIQFNITETLMFVQISGIKGFSVTPEASPFILINPRQNVDDFQFVLDNTNFDFYDRNRRLLGSDFHEYLISFFNMTAIPTDQLGLS